MFINMRQFVHDIAIGETFFCYKINFSLRELKFSGSMYFNYIAIWKGLHQPKLKEEEKKKLYFFQHNNQFASYNFYILI